MAPYRTRRLWMSRVDLRLLSVVGAPVPGGRPQRRARRRSAPAAPRGGAALSTPGMGDRLGVKVPWRKRWC
jgi:hypothetical protein